MYDNTQFFSYEINIESPEIQRFLNIIPQGWYELSK